MVQYLLVFLTVETSRIVWQGLFDSIFTLSRGVNYADCCPPLALVFSIPFCYLGLFTSLFSCAYPIAVFRLLCWGYFIIII